VSKRLISRRVLLTELHAIQQAISDQNYGYARLGVLQIMDRVKEYDLYAVKEKLEVKE